MSFTIGLSITSPDGSSRDVVYESENVLIGSGPSAALRLEEDGVSPIHAVLKVGPDRAVTVIDLGSKSGTMVNGLVAAQPVRVRVGDILGIGPTALQVSQLGARRAPEGLAAPTGIQSGVPGPRGGISGRARGWEASPVPTGIPSGVPSPRGGSPGRARGWEASPAPPGIQSGVPGPRGGNSGRGRGWEAPPVPTGVESVVPGPRGGSVGRGRGPDFAVGTSPSADDAWGARTLVDGEPASGMRGASRSRPSERRPAFDSEGRTVVAYGEDFDPALLRYALGEADRPTERAHALEISILWGNTVIDAIEVKGTRPVGVGPRSVEGSELTVDGGFPEDRFTLALKQGSEAQILVPSDARVGLRRADGQVTRDVMMAPADAPFPARSYALQLNERLVYQTGTLTVVAQFVRGDAELGAAAPFDWYFPRILAISALVFSFMVTAAVLTPVRARNLADDLFKNQNRFAQMILKPPEKEERRTLDLSGMKGGARAKGKKGRFGKKETPKKDARASKPGAPRVDPNKREKDRKIAMNAGLLRMLKGGDAGAVSNVFGPGGLGTGINDAMGGLRGTAMGDAGGAGGLGSRGTGRGGGGSSLAIGGLGTHGHGRGTGGYGNIDLGGRGKGTTRIVPGRTIIKGSLSREEIGRVIRRNLARFKFCYDKQLTRNPNLSGKISIYFTIAPTGSVARASVRETSMNDAKVEGCSVQVMRSLKFPRPRGGGIVVVTYPFVFDAT